MNRNAGKGKRADASSAGTKPGMLHRQRKRADTSSDTKGGHIVRKN